VKHSKAQQVDVQLVVGNDRIMLMVEDDGVGFSPESTSRSSGFGIYNMKERAELLGGKCIIESEKGTGTTLRIVIPQKVEE
jgi:signal transduction histidine kinase